MKAWDYYGVYLFAEDGSGHIGTYCNACLKEAHPEQDIEAENVSPIFATDEADYYDACEICGGVFDYINLTDDGIEYMREQTGIIRRFWDSQGKRLALWRVWYDGCFEYHVTTSSGKTIVEDFTEDTALARAGAVS